MFSNARFEIVIIYCFDQQKEEGFSLGPSASLLTAGCHVHSLLPVGLKPPLQTIKKNARGSCRNGPSPKGSR